MKAIIIGTGFGARVVAPAFETLGIACTVVSPHDSDAVLAAVREDVDLVSVHSPPFLHHEHVMAALDQGRAVLCDKPFGRNATEAIAMRDRAKEVGVLHFVNFEFRQQPGRVKLKEMLDQGAIGQLQHIGWSIVGSGLRGQKHRWLFDADMAGGWIGAFGSHCIDTLRVLTGSEVAQCGGTSRIEIKQRPDKAGTLHASTAEDAFTSWMLMENGVTVAYDTAYSAPVFLPQRLTLLGSEGVLELIDDLTLILRRPEAEPETIEIPRPEPGVDAHDPALIPWLARVRDALRDQTPIAPNFDDGVAAAKVMDALRAALVPSDR